MRESSTKLIFRVMGLASVGLFNLMPLAPAYAQTETQTNLRPAVQTEGDRLLLLSLLESTLIAVNNANLTGNYSVLKELASPTFQARFSLTNLADVRTNASSRFKHRGDHPARTCFFGTTYP